MPEPVYMLYYHGEFARRALNLSREQEWMLWCLCRANFFNGTLPKSPKRLAAICRMTLAEFRTEWPAIRKQFVRGDGGLQDPRMMELRETALRVKGAKSKGGKMTAEKNRQRKGPEHVGPAVTRLADRLRDQSRER